MVTDKLAAKLAAFSEITKRRGLLDVERAEYQAFQTVAAWIKQDEADAQRIEAEAAAAEETDRMSDPDQHKRDLFSSYRAKLKKEGRMR